MAAKIIFFKPHVKIYNKKDGEVVRAHDDKRSKKYATSHLNVALESLIFMSMSIIKKTNQQINNWSKGKLDGHLANKRE